jgi:hypothetical protein
MVYLLGKVAAGTEERTYSVLSDLTRRNDGESYISRNSSWMTEPWELHNGWFFEGCTSLNQKQAILEKLSNLGLSSTFVSCAHAFVEGQSVKSFRPTEAEQDEIVRQIEAAEAREFSES